MEMSGRLVSKAVAVAAVCLAASAAYAADGNVSVAGTVLAKTCTVSTGGVMVVLPQAAKSDFSGVGSHGKSKDFKIELDCTGSSSQIYMTLTDGTTASNRSDVLSLTSASTASGLGLQVLRNGGALVSYGPASDAPGTTNQFFVGSAAAVITAGGEIPFSVRYVQTATQMRAGSVSAIATFTMSYQ
jgi:type 1 fimbria pilin